MRGCAVELRVVIARLRAIEESLQRDLDDLEAQGHGVEDGSQDGRFLVGYGAGLLSAKGKVQRLREHLSAEAARSLR